VRVKHDVGTEVMRPVTANYLSKRLHSRTPVSVVPLPLHL